LATRRQTEPTAITAVYGRPQPFAVFERHHPPRRDGDRLVGLRVASDARRLLAHREPPEAGDEHGLADDERGLADLEGGLDGLSRTVCVRPVPEAGTATRP
jgi:hypothetical protein